MREATSNSALGTVSLKLRTEAAAAVATSGCRVSGRERPRRTARIVRLARKPTREGGYLAGMLACGLSLAVLGLAGSCPTCNTDHSNHHDAKLVAAPIIAAVPGPPLERASPAVADEKPTQTVAAESKPEPPVTASVNTRPSEHIGSVEPERPAPQTNSRQRRTSIQQDRTKARSMSNNYHRYPRSAAKMFEVPWQPFEYE